MSGKFAWSSVGIVVGSSLKGKTFPLYYHQSSYFIATLSIGRRDGYRHAAHEWQGSRGSSVWLIWGGNCSNGDDILQRTNVMLHCISYKHEQQSEYCNGSFQ